MDTTVSEIHAYPLRPEGYAEPLFHTARSRGEILEHLAKSSWLRRASEAPRPGWALYDGMPPEEGRVIASWREVDHWWEPGGGVDVVWRLIETGEGRPRAQAEPMRRQPASAA